MDDLDVSNAEEEIINPINLFGSDDEQDNNQQENERNEEIIDEPAVNTTAAAAPAPKKRKSINRHPNLNANYLTRSGKSDESIYKANSYFEDIKFNKGPNSEEKNLNKILRRYEYFAQQCYPKLCFQDFVEKCEKVSKKQPIRHALLSIRRKEDNGVNSGDEDIPFNPPENAQDENNSFNDVFPNSPITRIDDNNETVNNTEVNKENMENQPSENVSSQENAATVETERPVITDEMRQLMLKKRLEAIEKRKRKLEEVASSQDQPSQPQET